MNYDSEWNKKIIKEFVQKECFADMTDLVQFILDNCDDTMFGYLPPISQDDIENEGAHNPDLEEAQMKLLSLEEEEPNIYSEEWDKWWSDVEDAENKLATFDTGVKWIAVSRFLGEWLRSYDEEIIDCVDYYFWGIKKGENPCDRKVICEIAETLEILEGQKNDWSKYLKMRDSDEWKDIRQ